MSDIDNNYFDFDFFSLAKIQNNLFVIAVPSIWQFLPMASTSVKKCLLMTLA